MPRPKHPGWPTEADIRYMQAMSDHFEDLLDCLSRYGLVTDGTSIDDCVRLLEAGVEALHATK